MQASDPSLSSDPQLQTMRAAADYMMGRYRDAHNDIAAAVFDNDRHVALLRGLIETALENWGDAHKAFDMADPVIRRYPQDWQAKARIAEAKAAIATGAIESADAALASLPRDLDKTRALEAALTRGTLYAAEGRNRDAQTIFAAIQNSGDEGLEAQAIYDSVDAGLNAGSLSQDAAIQTLDKLRYRWRGDSLELKTLRRLGALYFAKQRWREGLAVLRVASLSFPNDDMGRRAQDDMRNAFEALFLKGQADKLRPVDALALFYDNIDLTPIGPDGDEMIRRMSDRLIAVDLLGPAAKLLDYQVNKRLDGIARSQVAARLAMIQLMDHNAKDALATLRQTQMAGLPDDINHQRNILQARALAALKQWDQALDIIAVDEQPDSRQLRADIYWESGNWAVAGQKTEELLDTRWQNPAPLSAEDRRYVMRAAIAYSLASDQTSLDRLRAHYGDKMKSSPDASAFAVVTQNIDLQGVAFRDMAGQIASVDTLEAFMQDFKKRYDKPILN
jgi:tetratricopeptide (TPR) repeat protein